MPMLLLAHTEAQENLTEWVAAAVICVAAALCYLGIRW